MHAEGREFNPHLEQKLLSMRKFSDLKQLNMLLLIWHLDAEYLVSGGSENASKTSPLGTSKTKTWIFQALAFPSHEFSSFKTALSKKMRCKWLFCCKKSGYPVIKEVRSRIGSGSSMNIKSFSLRLSSLVKCVYNITLYLIGQRGFQRDKVFRDHLFFDAWLLGKVCLARRSGVRLNFEAWAIEITLSIERNLRIGTMTVVAVACLGFLRKKNVGCLLLYGGGVRGVNDDVLWNFGNLLFLHTNKSNKYNRQIDKADNIM
ncbi:hypothetical protein BDR26DRAFT_707045 [Obelidium mucronatum]|nr:hypothetical protein BDR26DRAFT_707045 [Obelidium mucronatum]